MTNSAVSLLEVILYVADQRRSADFYTSLLERRPSRDVPGMTEFSLGAQVKLGLMPAGGIARLLGDSAPDPALGDGIPRCELYLSTPDVKALYARAIQIGATPLSPPSQRDWGDLVGYLADPDGHVIAFAQVE